MERRATTSEMSFVHDEGLSHKPIFGYNHNDLRDRREASDTHPHHFLARCTIVDDSSELSIFDAKKYFNEVSTNNLVTSIDPMLMLKGQSIDQDSDKDSELSRSKPWTCGGVTPPSSMVASKFSPIVASIDGYRQSYRARSFHSTTPTASSEASWNSQTGLLSNPPGAIFVSVLHGDSSPHLQKKTRKPPMSSSITGRWIFGSSKCPCIGKKSIQVHESKVILDPKARPYINNNNTTKDKDKDNFSESESSTSSKKTSSDNTMFLQHSDNVIWSTQKCVPPNLLLQGPTTQRVIASTSFSFPILKNKSNGNNEDHFSIRSINPILIQDPPRDSLEVFKPSSVKDDNGDNDLKSRILANVAATGGNATIISDIDDMASDASSDLFEIESFSTQTASTTTISYSSMFHRRDSMELEARRLGLNAAATHCSLDEPMTPSSDWYEPSEASIDWSVTTAEGFDRASIANMSEVEEPWTEKNNINKNNNHRRRTSSGNGLLSCRSEKAVSVGPQPVTKHVGSRPPLGKKPPTPLARSSSARHSLTFAA